MNSGNQKDKKNSKTTHLQQETGDISDKVQETKIKITGWRLRLFRLIALIVIPTLFIFILEIGLRVTGYGFNPKAIINCYVKGEKEYCDNMKYGWLYFPPNVAREFIPFVFPVNKAQNTYRIFVFGSSAAQGVPDVAYGFSRILECMLSEKYPEVNFEVINTAMTAINSHVVVEIAEECAQYEPDLFIVYMGNNEIIGPYGAGTVFAPLSDNLTLIHLGITFMGTKLGQLLTNISYAAGWRKAPNGWVGMAMYLDRQVSADDQKLQIVYKNFSRNLDMIVKAAQKVKTPVILSTVASNLKDCPPFASLHRKGISENDANRFGVIYKQAREIDRQGRYEPALEKYLEAEKIDNQFAELQYCIGRCCYLLSRFDEAKERFIKARDLDTIRLRTDSRINEIIRETAQNKDSKGVYLADAVKSIDEQSPQKTAGSELFYEHVHLNFEGNFVLAKTVFEQVGKILSEKIKGQKSAGQEVIDVNQCMQTLVYSIWDKYTTEQSMLDGYIVHPPISNQLYHSEQVKSYEKQINSLQNKLNKQVLLQIGADYRKAIEKKPSDWWLHWKYGSFLMDALQNYKSTEIEFATVLEFVPQNYSLYCLLGNTYVQRGNYDKAMEQFNKALKIKPTWAPAYYDLGLVYQLENMTREAERSYKKALSLCPQDYLSYVNLGVLFADNNRIDEAIELYRNALELWPDSEDLHFNIGCFLREKGKMDEAVKEFRTVLKINPGYKLPKEIQDELFKRQ